MMPVEINQWRATIWYFCPSMQLSLTVSKTVGPVSISNQILQCTGFATVTLENRLLITDFTEKSHLFNQCTTIDTGCQIPQHDPVTTTLIDEITVSERKILNIIRSLKIDKADCWDQISVRMIRLSDATLIYR